jgi:hypothetical protein
MLLSELYNLVARFEQSSAVALPQLMKQGRSSYAENKGILFQTLRDGLRAFAEQSLRNCSFHFDHLGLPGQEYRLVANGSKVVDDGEAEDDTSGRQEEHTVHALA